MRDDVIGRAGSRIVTGSVAVAGEDERSSLADALHRIAIFKEDVWQLDGQPSANGRAKGLRKATEIEIALFPFTKMSARQKIGRAGEKMSMGRTKTPVSQTVRPPSTMNKILEVSKGIAEIVTI